MSANGYRHLQYKVSDVNEFDIGPVTNTDTTGPIAIAENAGRGTYTGITVLAVDADVTGSVSGYSVSDNRFEVDDDGRVTVAAGAQFDAETEGGISITVTATSTDGLTSEASFRIDVTDVDEFAVGPITDSDSTENTFGAAGGYTGITVAAIDEDMTATVTYSVSDDRFEVDANDRLRAKAGTVFDPAESEIEITITATSSDGSTSTAIFLLDAEDIA
ncbi:MAG: hypothetical protein ACJAXK_001715 [Yoonia sp.]